eukprot:maker-scaffold_1-snap-gene-7.37-mRNA-1 protein AED:0.00 eAED:0.00 QI:56/1/1/1/1/1/2/970/209
MEIQNFNSTIIYNTMRQFSRTGYLSKEICQELCDVWTQSAGIHLDEPKSQKTPDLSLLEPKKGDFNFFGAFAKVIEREMGINTEIEISDDESEESEIVCFTLEKPKITEDFNENELFWNADVDEDGASVDFTLSPKRKRQNSETFSIERELDENIFYPNLESENLLLGTVLRVIPKGKDKISISAKNCILKINGQETFYKTLQILLNRK